MKKMSLAFSTIAEIIEIVLDLDIFKKRVPDTSAK